jgi:hypothetical protein
MDERKEKLKKRETLFIDTFWYSPFGTPIKTHQVQSLPSLSKELEGRLLENFHLNLEDDQINSHIKV